MITVSNNKRKGIKRAVDVYNDLYGNQYHRLVYGKYNLENYSISYLGNYYYVVTIFITRIIYEVYH